MTTQLAGTSVQTSIVVDAPVDRAFDVFTRDIGSWWPPEHHILDGQLARISFLGFPSLAFDSVLQTMEATYGKAKVAVEEIRAMKKGKLVDKHATWRNDAGDVIIFDKYSPGNINYAYLNYYADSYRKRAGMD